MHYVINYTSLSPELEGTWDGPGWDAAHVAEVAHFHPKGSDHRPTTHVKVLYDDENLHAMFRVADRYVRCRHTQYNAMVCQDSCVELFVRPKPDRGYFNFEVNCGGALLLSYIEDPTRTPDGFRRFTRVPEPLGRRVEIRHSLPENIEHEIPDPVTWYVACRIPFKLFEVYVGPIEAFPGRIWRGNFYKCADESTHPHWGSWTPQGEPLNFHRPEIFGEWHFARG